jgi:predicted ATPase
VSREALGDFAQKVLVDNWRGRALVGKGEFEQGLRLTRGATERWRQAEGRICSAMFWLGEVMALRGMGDAEGAIERVEECIRHCRDTGDVYMLPEALRVKAELLVATGREQAPGVVGSSGTFAEAMDLARQQGARSFQLRIASSIAAYHLAGGRVDAAKDVLAPVLETFTEGFDTADLRRAAAMLSTIAGSA